MKCPNCKSELTATATNSRSRGNYDKYLTCEVCRAKYKLSFMQIKEPVVIDKTELMFNIILDNKGRDKKVICDIFVDIYGFSDSSARDYYRRATNLIIEARKKELT